MPSSSQSRAEHDAASATGTNICAACHAPLDAGASEAYYRDLYIRAPAMLIALDERGQIVSVSDEWLRVLGYAREDVLGRRQVEFLTAESQRRVRDEMWPDFIKTGRCSDLELACVTRQGETLDVTISAVAERDEQGRIGRSMALVTDMTSRNMMQRQLAQAQKMEAVGQLTGGLAHDFNNILGVIIGNLQLIQRSAGQDEKMLKRIRAARLAAQGGADLTRRLLTMSRQGELEREVVMPSPLIHDMWDMLSRTLGKAIRLRATLDDALPRIRTDPTQFQSALLNLALNARDAMPDGGMLTLSSGTINGGELSHQATGGATCHDRYVWVRMADTGMGIEAEALPHVMEPFFTTKVSGEGTGLGLSMIYGLVSRSDGHFDIQSTVGEGTIVTLYFPVCDAPSVGDSAPSQDGSVGSPEGGAADWAGYAAGHLTGELALGRDELVLVVEDRADLRDVTIAMLEDLGYRTVWASSGEEALEQLRTDGDIALLFTEDLLPMGVDGPRLARQARGLRPDLPVVFTTGHVQHGAQDTGRFGNDLVVFKPYTRDVLASALDRALTLSAEQAHDPGHSQGLGGTASPRNS